MSRILPETAVSSISPPARGGKRGRRTTSSCGVRPQRRGRPHQGHRPGPTAGSSQPASSRSATRCTSARASIPGSSSGRSRPTVGASKVGDSQPRRGLHRSRWWLRLRRAGRDVVQRRHRCGRPIKEFDDLTYNVGFRRVGCSMVRRTSLGRRRQRLRRMAHRRDRRRHGEGPQLLRHDLGRAVLRRRARRVPLLRRRRRHDRPDPWWDRAGWGPARSSWWPGPKATSARQLRALGGHRGLRRGPTAATGRVTTSSMPADLR